MICVAPHLGCCGVVDAAALAPGSSLAEASDYTCSISHFLRVLPIKIRLVRILPLSKDLLTGSKAYWLTLADNPSGDVVSCDHLVLLRTSGRVLV